MVPIFKGFMRKKPLDLVSMTRQHGEETWLEVALQGKVLAHRPLPLGCFTSWVIFMVKMIERALCFLVPDNPGSSTLTLCMTCRLQLFLIHTYLLALADGWPVALHLSSTVYQQPPFCCKLVVCHTTTSMKLATTYLPLALLLLFCKWKQQVFWTQQQHCELQQTPQLKFMKGQAAALGLILHSTNSSCGVNAQHPKQLLMEWYKSVGK